MNVLRNFPLLVKEIGIPDLLRYGYYQFQLKSGYLRLCTPIGGSCSRRELVLEAPFQQLQGLADWDNSQHINGQSLLTEEASLLLHGEYRPFFANTESLSFPRLATQQHWTEYSNEFAGEDIKFTWEPARFVWSLALARAYKTTKNLAFSELFWQKFEEFLSNNPVNSGPNWASAQEVALRMMMWILAIPAFKNSPLSTPARLISFTHAIQQHVLRLLPTLDYARSQHNNHLLSEALGLIFGGDFLRDCDSRAQQWVDKGLREFELAVLNQIDDYGNYSQHSANYHRMMLQLALLYFAFLKKTDRQIPDAVKTKLSLSTHWLITQLDLVSGRLPNLGHNDGTLLLAFGCTDFRDYRPTAQAAAIAFLGQPCLPPGQWDELALWLGLDPSNPLVSPQMVASPAIHKLGTSDCWGSMRGVRFQNRPAHADQLHVEIWCNGENLARDAGTYLYNGSNPWQNALDATQIHNTVTIDGKDQMQRVSRFLWLDHAQADWQETGQSNKITAAHNGYRKLGIRHERSLEYQDPHKFIIIDTLTPAPSDLCQHVYRLHWLLADWGWSLEGQKLTLTKDKLNAVIHTSAFRQSTGEKIIPSEVSLIRGGKNLIGQAKDEVAGWESDTYGEKHPVLSFSLYYSATGSITITTDWNIINQ